MVTYEDAGDVGGVIVQVHDDALAPVCGKVNLWEVCGRRVCGVCVREPGYRHTVLQVPQIRDTDAGSVNMAVFTLIVLPTVYLNLSGPNPNTNALTLTS